MKKHLFLILVLAGSIAWVGAFPGSIQAEPAITLDGSFTDWNGISPIGTDIEGDISSNDIVDWTNLWAVSNSQTLYLSYQTASNIDFTSNAWRYAVYIDTDNNASTGYKGTDGSFLIGAEYLIEGCTLHRYTGTGTNWSWSAISYLSYSISGNRIEMAIPEESLGLTPGCPIKIMLLGNNPQTTDYGNDDRSGYEYP